MLGIRVAVHGFVSFVFWWMQVLILFVALPSKTRLNQNMSVNPKTPFLIPMRVLQIRQSSHVCVSDNAVYYTKTCDASKQVGTGESAVIEPRCGHFGLAPVSIAKKNLFQAKE